MGAFIWFAIFFAWVRGDSLQTVHRYTVTDIQYAPGASGIHLGCTSSAFHCMFYIFYISICMFVLFRMQLLNEWYTYSFKAYRCLSKYRYTLGIPRFDVDINAADIGVLSSVLLSIILRSLVCEILASCCYHPLQLPFRQLSPRGRPRITSRGDPYDVMPRALSR